MNALRSLTMCAVLGMSAMMVTACGSSDDAVDLERSSTLIAYTHEDGSTPPASHKEYQIVVADGVATLTLGGYGSLSGQATPEVTDTPPVDDEVWQKLVDGVGSLPDASPQTTPCAGAGTTSVKITADGDVVKDLTVTGCGAGDTADRLAEFIAPVESLFDMKSYLGR